MIGIAGIKPKLEINLHVSQALPAVLSVNMVVLFGLDRMNLIPEWIRTMAGLFLAF